MTENRKLANKIFAFIQDAGYTPINIEYGDYYFIMDMGKDGICHFQIKELRSWKFGMWIDSTATGSSPQVQLFCQHKLNIDKFKPGRSCFCINFSYKYMMNDDAYGCGPFVDLVHTLQMIKRHPFISFDHDCMGSFYFTSRSAMLTFLYAIYCEIHKRTMQFFQDWPTFLWTHVKMWFLRRYKVVDSVELIDGNDTDIVSYPRWTLRIQFKKVSNFEDEQECAQYRVLYRWFHKYYYNNLHVYAEDPDNDCE